MICRKNYYFIKMPIKTKYIINHFLVLMLVCLIFSCATKKKIKTPVIAPEYRGFNPPAYNHENDEYYVAPVINHDDRYDDNRDRMYH